MNIRKTVAAASTGGLVMTAFGLIAANPAFAATCDGVTPIPATEAALRTALAGTDPVICINAGTIDLSDIGADSTANNFNIDRSVTIIGIGDVVFDSDGQTGAFFVDNDGIDLELNHLILQNTSDNEAGGAVYFNSDGHLTIRNSIVRANDSHDATVTVNHYGATVTIEGSTFFGNTSYTANGGAIYSAANISIDDSTFTSNDAFLGRGGALYTANSATVTNSTFEANLSENGDGGAIYTYGNLDVSDSTFIDNSATNGRGGALYTDSAFTATGSYFEGNSATDDGGAAFGINASIVINDTFVNNHTDTKGGALRLWNGSEVLFSTFTGNSADMSGNAINSTAITTIANLFADGTSLEIDSNSADVTDGGGNITTSTQADDTASLDSASSKVAVSMADLKLSDAADNGGPTWTVALGEGSAARDVWTEALNTSSTSTNLPTVDQRGTSRTFSYDAGAYEAGPILAATGVDASGIALTGGVIGAAGVALVARRRRNRA